MNGYGSEAVSNETQSFSFYSSDFSNLKKLEGKLEGMNSTEFFENQILPTLKSSSTSLLFSTCFKVSFKIESSIKFSCYVLKSQILPN